MNKSQTERDIELAVDHFRMALQATLFDEDFTLYIQVRGVNHMDLLLLENKETCEIVTMNDCGIDGNQDNYSITMELPQTTISLNTLSDAEWIASK